MGVGLGIWIGYTENNWTVTWTLGGLGALTLGAVYADPWLKKYGKSIIEVLEVVGLAPKPTEAYMYVISLSLIFMLFFGDIWKDMGWVLEHDKKGNSFWIYLYTILGAGYSIYFAFSQRAKTDFEIAVLKYYTAVFSVALSIATAVYAYETKVEGYYILTA